MPVSSPQASPKVEASNRPKQAQHLPTCRKVQIGNTRVHQDLSDSRGMGVVDRLIRRLPSHPHPPKLREVPKVLPQVTGVPVHLPSPRASHSPTGLYNGCKRSEADLLSRSNQVQSTEWSLHPQVFKQICLKWFTLHVDLFATCLNHNIPLYVTPVPDQNAWDLDALNINWSGLTAYAYPPTALLHRVIQKSGNPVV